jgi:signal transduction histidine kinase
VLTEDSPRLAGNMKIPRAASHAIRGLPGRIADIDSFARLSIIIIVIGVLAASAIAWLIDDRVTDLMLAEVRARAVDQVDLTIAGQVSVADFEQPFTRGKLDAIAARLDPVVSHLRPDGIIRFNLIAPDGTIVYSDRAGLRGAKMSEADPVLRAALAGSATQAVSSLSGAQDAHLTSHDHTAAEVVVPIVIDGRIVGVYQIYEDLSQVRPARSLIWSSVLGTLVPLFLVFLVVGREATNGLREKRAKREQLAQQTTEVDAMRTFGRLKSDLLSAVSHELRTPLSIVHGYSELLAMRSGEFDADQVKEIASEINRGSSMMARIVDDLLDFSRIEQGRLRLDVRETDLVAVVRETLELFHDQRGAERLALDAPRALVGTLDPVRVRQVVANLVSNALRYAPTGPIDVRVREQPGGLAMIEVRDSGPGISPEAMPHIWEMFYRAPEAMDSPISGTGIGLALVKNLVEAHGGQAEAQSEPNKGATFRVYLPLEQAAAPGASLVEQSESACCDSADRASSSGRRVGAAGCPDEEVAGTEAGTSVALAS